VGRIGRWPGETPRRQVRTQEIIVVSLNMAGSVLDEADLVVTDPVQAGVMTVILVARTAKLDIRRQRGLCY
jgi:energy-converting hydrogenase B subunit Q